MRARGWECDDFDSKANGKPNQDLSRDNIWTLLLARIKNGFYDAVIAGPPCETFSHARQVQPGPRPLRSFERPYGLPKSELWPDEWEQLRMGNLLALRNAEACKSIHQAGGAFIIENPREWEGSPAIWLLDEYKELASLPGVEQMVIDQCGFGAASQKPTRLMYARVHLEVAAYSCKHPKRQFWDNRGKAYWAAHERLVGRKDASGQWATRAAAAWPAKLNDIFTSVIVHAGPLVTGEASSSKSLDKDWQGVEASVRPRQPSNAELLQRSGTVEQPYKLSGPDREYAKDIRRKENEEALGGMRDPRLSIQKLPEAYTVGRKLRKVLERFLDQEPGTIDIVKRALNKEPIEFPKHHLRRLRRAISKALGNHTASDDKQDGIYGRIIRDWCRAVGDPDEVIATWLYLGAPIGIINPVEHTGVFPQVLHPDITLLPSDISSSPLGWENYESMDEHEEAASDLMQKAEDSGFCQSFETWKELCDFVG